MILLSTILSSTVLQSVPSGEFAVDHLFRLWMVIMLPTFGMLLFIVIENIADNQQYNFQTQKQNKAVLTGKYSISLHTGFLSEGLWNYVRHPNFISEQAIWVSFYFFGVAASNQFLNWTMIGPFLLIILFAGSSEFTERISMEKYPEYKNYKRHVPKFIPLIFKQRKRE